MKAEVRMQRFFFILTLSDSSRTNAFPHPRIHASPHSFS